MDGCPRHRRAQGPSENQRPTRTFIAGAGREKKYKQIHGISRVLYEKPFPSPPSSPFPCDTERVIYSWTYLPGLSVYDT